MKTNKTFRNLLLLIVHFFPFYLFAQTVTTVETDNTWRVFPSPDVPLPNPRDTPTVGWLNATYDDAIAPWENATLNRAQIFALRIGGIDPTACNGQITFPSGVANMIWYNSILLRQNPLDAAFFRKKFTLTCSNVEEIIDEGTFIDGYSDDQMQIYLNGYFIGNIGALSRIDASAFKTFLVTGTNIISVYSEDTDPIATPKCVGFGMRLQVSTTCPAIIPCSIHVDFDADTTQNPVVFTSTSTYSPTGTPNYIWSFGDGTISTGTEEPTISHTYALPGKYNVCLNVVMWDTIENKMVCCDMLCKDIYINVDTTNACVARASVINQIDGNTVTVTDNSVINTTITTSVWSFDDGDGLVNGLTATHTFQEPGLHVIIHYIGVTSPWGPCCGIVLDTVIIQGDSLPTQAMRTKSSGKVGFGNFETKKENTFKIFPNPANSKINLLYTYSGNEKSGVLNLTRMDGQLAFAEQFSLVQTAPLEFDISDISNGMYFYTIMSKQGTILASGKITILHNE